MTLALVESNLGILASTTTLLLLLGLQTVSAVY
jgi:hypothetical protein